ncbi:GNAT family N-acetyltransferase [Candidatus Dojkabacteria bacterium]|nr:GNAT family N-acetyltransferase [Candidatus Dojkabacteria bacterium]
MFRVCVLRDNKTAKEIGEFLTSRYAFDQTWAPNEKAMVRKAAVDSLKNKNHQYWYVKNEGKIIAAIGVRENKYGSGGYEMDSDYLAVHSNFRKKGVGTLLILAMETFVKDRKGRYIHILTCDIDSYKPALKFYEKNGYKRVANIPNYYVKGEGRIDLLKEFT